MKPIPVFAFMFIVTIGGKYTTRPIYFRSYIVLFALIQNESLNSYRAPLFSSKFD